ncbi:Protein CLEC-41, partial [Aphelenchoides avenae]
AELIAAATDGCRDPTYKKAAGGGTKCLKYFPELKTRAEAKTACGQNAHLVYIQNAAQNTELRTFLTGVITDGSIPPPVWIGLQCTNGDDAQCKWDDNSAQAQNADPTNPTTQFWAISNDQLAAGTAGKNHPAFSGTCVNSQFIGTPAAGNEAKWIMQDCTQKNGFVCEEAMTCTDPGYTMGSDGQCYYFVATKANYADAQTFCNSKGGHLAAIHGSDLNTWILNQAKNVYSWPETLIGFKFDGAAFQWPDSSDNGYWNWQDHFPDNRFGQCVKMISANGADGGKWRNARCDEPFPYVCQANSQASSSNNAGPANKCPPVFYSNTGTIYSPGYPGYYGDNLDCTYQIEAATTGTASITFSALSLETSDFVQIFDGDCAYKLPSECKLLNTIQSGSTSVIGSPITSTSNILTVRFKSVAHPAPGNKATGFKADYVAGTVQPPPPGPTCIGGSAGSDDPQTCPASNTLCGSGTISSPGYQKSLKYGSLVDCTYQLQASDANQVVQLKFSAAQTEQCCDYIKIYDGADGTGDPKWVVAGDYAQADLPNIVSSGQYLYLEFTSDNSNSETGWQASFSTVAKPSS